MSTNRHQRVSEIFLRACELPPDQRAGFLDEACDRDAGLREEVEALLAHDEKAGELLDAAAVHREIVSKVDAWATSDPTGHHPAQIGTYRILGILGEGGQGIVYKAEQKQPRRPVALKVLKGWSHSGESDARRFELEIQALAAVRHPAIATVFDAGETEDGCRYFSMELVAGVPINEHAKRENLTVPQRLELFCKVCDGVQHAHEHGIVHRDLKPANVLVDSDGNPRILDFGLVQMLDRDGAFVPTLTRAGYALGSLRYMSPEQASGQTHQSGAATDVYSLGVILYEILTGKWPYEVGESLPQAVRTICETRPVRPSVVTPALRGDLETIVLKALEKEHSRRYPSVAELAADVHRFLEGRPILARPPSRLYAFKKALLRHRAAATVGIAALLLASVGMAVTGLWETKRSAAQLTAARIAVAGALHVSDLGPVESGIGTAERLVTKYPKLPEATLVLAQAKYKAAKATGGYFWDSARVLRAGLGADPSQWAFRLLLAEIYEQIHDPEAKDLKARADREAGDTSEAWYLRSLATLDLSKARRSAARALELDAGNWPAWARLYYVCLRLHDLECAQDAARHVADGLDPRWKGLEGHALTLQRRHREAIAAYAGSGKAGSASPFARFIALNHLCLEEYDEAIRDLALISKAPGADPYLYYKRATPLWITGRTEEAVADYEEFRRLTGHASLADARLFLVRHDHARRLERQGEPERARALVAKARLELRTAQEGAKPGSWIERVLKSLAGEISPEDLVNSVNRADPGQVCEGFYYAAEASLLEGRIEAARKGYAACVGTGLVFDPNQFPPDPMNEYHLAQWRLRQLG